MTEGLRSRKKRELRQRISDTGTAMFLEHGYDEVKVSDIARACDVSEKTIYNYFPTKEAILFDREEDQAAQLTEALRDRGDEVSIIDSIVAAMVADVTAMYSAWVSKGSSAPSLSTIRKFGDMIETTPALTAAFYGMTERGTQVAATALAARAGVDPEDPEPQMAATIVMGLWRTQYRAMQRYADSTLSIEEVQAAVIDEIRRAAGIAAIGLSSFNAVVRSTNSKEQIREAADAAELARKQVMAAVKQARAAWRQIMAEVQAHHAGDDDIARTKQEIRAQQHEMRAEIRRHQQELRRQTALLREQQARARSKRR